MGIITIIVYYISTNSWRGYIFTAVCLSVCVCVCLYVCVSGTSCEQNSSQTECDDLDAIFVKWLLTALTQTLLNLVTLGQRSR